MTLNCTWMQHYVQQKIQIRTENLLRCFSVSFPTISLYLCREYRYLQSLYSCSPTPLPQVSDISAAACRSPFRLYPIFLFSAFACEALWDSSSLYIYGLTFRWRLLERGEKKQFEFKLSIALVKWRPAHLDCILDYVCILNYVSDLTC